jgi:hypothetical protein
VEPELLTLPGHMSSPTGFSGVRVTRSLVLYVCFVDRCLSFCPFSFGNCVVYLRILITSLVPSNSYCTDAFYRTCTVRIYNKKRKRHTSSMHDRLASKSRKFFVNFEMLVVIYIIKYYISVRAMVLNATFNYISVILWRSVFMGGGNRSTRRKPPTCRKSVTHFIT